MINKAADKSDFDSNYAIGFFIMYVFVISQLMKQILTSVVIPWLPFIKRMLIQKSMRFLSQFAIGILKLEK